MASDGKMLFIDDVHPESMEATDIVPVDISMDGLIGDVSELCRDIVAEANQNTLVTLDRETALVRPEFIVLESEMGAYTLEVIEILRGLSKRKRYRFREGFGGFCGQEKLLNTDETPTCLGYDVGLTYFKDKILGFTEGKNVLSEVYAEQQTGVTHSYKKVNPDFELSQIYY